MIKYQKIHPSKISLVEFSRILDGTVSTLNAMQNDVAAWLFPARVEDGITLNMTGESSDYEEQGSSGVLVQKDSVVMRKGVEFTVNMGRWTFEIDQLRRGGKASDVASGQSVSVAANGDNTTAKGVSLPSTVTTEKFAALMEMPANKTDGTTLYLFFPKVGISISDIEMTLNHAQQTPGLTFRAYGLETSELNLVQSIYSGATDDGLFFPIEA